MLILYEKMRVTVEGKRKQLIEMFENKISDLQRFLKKYSEKIVENYLRNIDSIDSSEMIVKQIKNEQTILTEFEQEILWCSKFIGIMKENPSLYQIDEKQMNLVEEAYKNSMILIDQTNDLWTHINEWKNEENKIKSVPFAELNYLHIKESTINLKRYIETLSENKLVIENSRKFISLLSTRADSLTNLIDSTAFLQKINLLPTNWIYKIIKILDLDSERFTLNTIDLVAIKKAQPEIEKLMRDAKEDILIFNTLERLKKEINSAELIVNPISSFGQEQNMYMLTDYEGFFELLQSNQTKLEELRNLSTGGNYLRLIKQIDEDIEKMQEAAEEIVIVQDKWLQLKKMYDCKAVQDISQSGAKEVQEQGNEILIILGSLHKSPNAKNFLLDPTLISELKNIEERQIKVQKEIDELLENKRLLIPRLLFLTNTQLIDFLHGVQNRSYAQINRIFPGISKLVLKEKNKDSRLPPDCVYSDTKESKKDRHNILKWLNEEKLTIEKVESNKIKLQSNFNEIEGFSSDELELLRLNEPIALVDSSILGENLEWVIKLEHEMQQVVAKLITLAINSFTNASLEEWVLDFPLQVILTAVHMIITHEITELLKPDTDDDEEQEQSHESEKVEDRPKKVKEKRPVELKIKTDTRPSKAGTIAWSPTVEPLTASLKKEPDNEPENENENENINENDSESEENKSKITSKDIKDMFSSFIEDSHFPSKQNYL